MLEHPATHLNSETTHDRLRLGMLALIMIVYMATCALSVAIPDTTRDVYVAYEISRGRWLPLEGPVFGGAIHLGPIWYYLLAIPLFFVRSWIVLVLFAAAIAALKFWFAYLCGSRLVDRDFALIWASCLAFPGWTTLEQVTLFTPNITEAAVLAVVLLNIALWRRHSWLLAFTLGLACGLAIHSHPTTVVGLPLSLASALLASSRPTRLRTALIFLSGFALLFIPYAASQVHSGLADFEKTSAYISGNVSLSQLLNVPAIWYAALIAGPLLIGSYLLQLGGVKLWIYKVAFAAVASASLIGVVRSFFAGPHRPILIGTLIIVCVLTIEIAFLRVNTPVYFLYALIPFLSALMALGLWHVGRMLQLRYLSLGVAGLAITGELLLASARAIAMHNGVGTLPDFSDIVTSDKRAPYTDIWFPAHEHDASGEFLCAHGDKISVHGPLAYLVDRNLNVDAMLRCDRNPSIELSGSISRERLHVIGLPRAFWEVLHATPRCWLGPIGITPAARVLWPPTSIPQVSPRTYYPRSFASGPSVTETFTFDARPSEAVVITNVVFGYAPWEIASVEANGNKVEPASKTEMSRLYVAPRSMGPAVQWRISYTTPDPSRIDFATVSADDDRLQSVSSCNSDTGWQSLTRGTPKST